MAVAAAPLGPDDLVLCAGSLPRASLVERLDAARAGGFRAISLWARAVEPVADLGALLARRGVVVSEIEALSDVLADPETPRRPGPRETLCHAIADAVGARSVSIVEGPGPRLAIAPAAAAFAAICDRAAAHDLAVHLEFWPHSR